MLNSNDILKKANEALQKAVDEKNRRKLEADRNFIVSQVGRDLKEALTPTLEALSRDSAQVAKEAIRQMQDAKMPDVVIPEIRIPTPQISVTADLSSINIPKPNIEVNPIVKLPDINFPETQKIEGWVQLQGVSLERPLPVQLRNPDGSPFSFSGITNILSQGGGGNRHVIVDSMPGLTISSGTNTSVSLVNADGTYYNSANPLPVTITESITLSDTTDTVGTLQVSGAVDSVVVNDILAVSTVFPVSQVSGANWSVNIASQDFTFDTKQVSGSINSVKVTGFDVSVAASIIDSSGVGYSGSNPLPVSSTQSGTWNIGTVSTVTAVTDITNSVKSALIDSSGVQYSGSNPVPINLVSQSLASSASALVDSSGVQYSGSNPVPITWVSGSPASVASSIVDSSGIGYSGSNPVPITIISGALTSVISVGDTLHDAADIGAAPVKVGGVAMTTNPTAVADGDRVNFRADDLGRQLTRPIQVRDLLTTAYLTLSDSSEDTLLTGTASTYYDLVYIMGANQSNAAVNVNIRSTTAGPVVCTLSIPANATTGVSLPVPIPQNDAAGTWTAQNSGSDLSNTTVIISALFAKEV